MASKNNNIQEKDFYAVHSVVQEDSVEQNLSSSSSYSNRRYQKVLDPAKLQMSSSLNESPNVVVEIPQSPVQPNILESVCSDSVDISSQNSMSESPKPIDNEVEKEKKRKSSGAGMKKYMVKQHTSDVIQKVSVSPVKLRNKRRPNRAGSICKKSRLNDLLNAENTAHTQLRMTLFYDDDVIQDLLQMKQKIKFRQQYDGQNTEKKFDEKFKKVLREEQGIFFDIKFNQKEEIQDTDSHDGVNMMQRVNFMQMKSTMPRQSFKQIDSKPLQVITQENSSLNDNSNQLTQTKRQSSFASYKFSQASQMANSIEKKDTQQVKHIDLDVDRRLEKQATGSVKSNVNSAGSRIDDLDLLESPMQKKLKQKVDENSAICPDSPDKRERYLQMIEDDKKMLERMQDLGEWLDTNYRSPDIKTIKKQVRMREINDIDVRRQSTRQLMQQNQLTSFMDRKDKSFFGMMGAGKRRMTCANLLLTFQNKAIDNSPGLGNRSNKGGKKGASKFQQANLLKKDIINEVDASECSNQSDESPESPIHKLESIHSSLLKTNKVSTSNHSLSSSDSSSSSSSSSLSSCSSKSSKGKNQGLLQAQNESKKSIISDEDEKKDTIGHFNIIGQGQSSLLLKNSMKFVKPTLKRNNFSNLHIDRIGINQMSFFNRFGGFEPQSAIPKRQKRNFRGIQINVKNIQEPQSAVPLSGGSWKKRNSMYPISFKNHGLSPMKISNVGDFYAQSNDTYDIDSMMPESSNTDSSSTDEEKEYLYNNLQQIQFKKLSVLQRKAQKQIKNQKEKTSDNTFDNQKNDGKQGANDLQYSNVNEKISKLRVDTKARQSILLPPGESFFQGHKFKEKRKASALGCLYTQDENTSLNNSSSKLLQHQIRTNSKNQICMLNLQGIDRGHPFEQTSMVPSGVNSIKSKNSRFNKICKDKLDLDGKKKKRKERKRMIKKLFKSTLELEEDEFVKNQQKCLMRLKEIAEQLKGSKITENCYNQDTITVQDESKSDATYLNSQDPSPLMRSLQNKANQQRQSILSSERLRELDRINYNINIDDESQNLEYLTQKQNNFFETQEFKNLNLEQKDENIKRGRRGTLIIQPNSYKLHSGFINQDNQTISHRVNGKGSNGGLEQLDEEVSQSIDNTTFPASVPSDKQRESEKNPNHPGSQSQHQDEQLPEINFDNSETQSKKNERDQADIQREQQSSKSPELQAPSFHSPDIINLQINSSTKQMREASEQAQNNDEDFQIQERQKSQEEQLFNLSPKTIDYGQNRQETRYFNRSDYCKEKVSASINDRSPLYLTQGMNQITHENRGVQHLQSPTGNIDNLLSNLKKNLKDINKELKTKNLKKAQRKSTESDFMSQNFGKSKSVQPHNQYVYQPSTSQSATSFNPLQVNQPVNQRIQETPVYHHHRNSVQYRQSPCNLQDPVNTQPQIVQSSYLSSLNTQNYSQTQDNINININNDSNYLSQIKNDVRKGNNIYSYNSLGQSSQICQPRYLAPYQQHVLSPTPQKEQDYFFAQGQQTTIKNKPGSYQNEVRPKKVQNDEINDDLDQLSSLFMLKRNRQRNQQLYLKSLTHQMSPQFLGRGKINPVVTSMELTNDKKKLLKYKKYQNASHNIQNNQNFLNLDVQQSKIYSVGTANSYGRSSQPECHQETIQRQEQNAQSRSRWAQGYNTNQLPINK